MDSDAREEPAPAPAIPSFATFIVRVLYIIYLCSFTLTLTVHLALFELTFFFAYFACTTLAISIYMILITILFNIFSHYVLGRSGIFWPTVITVLFLVGFTVMFVGAVVHAVLEDIFLAWLFPGYDLTVFV